jgi:hypothetical protein
VVCDSIETFVSFSFVWNVCVAVGCMMTMWQGSCQVKCAWQKTRGAMAEGCATMHISNVVFGFQFQGRLWKISF